MKKPRLTKGDIDIVRAAAESYADDQLIEDIDDDDLHEACVLEAVLLWVVRVYEAKTI